ncbi:agouti-related protein-like [Hippocampus zosterae]|uniref:agouti-related protein-like n=1 Tax=Hippocampus zosterae TaxID=109293 RepID=UPI00223CB288|nr:agouti-related protein-like [Hippocampus zosterae]
MKLSVLLLCVLHLAFVSGRLLTSNDLPSGSGNFTKISRRAGNFPSRYRTLFARREQYEKQKLLMMRPKSVPVLSEDPPTKAPPKPASATCSQLGQSCLPHQGCCVPCSTCHCHFFKAICFCRRINTQCTKNT